MISSTPSQTSQQERASYPTLEQACKEEGEEHQRSSLPDLQHACVEAQRIQRQHSIHLEFQQTCNEIQSQRQHPILPRLHPRQIIQHHPLPLREQTPIIWPLVHHPPETVQDPPSQPPPKQKTPPVQPIISPIRRKKSKQPAANRERKVPLNKCPAPGTLAAKMRTLSASVARCKTVGKKIQFLAEHGMTLEGFEEWKRANEEDKTKRLLTESYGGRSPREETPDDVVVVETSDDVVVHGERTAQSVLYDQAKMDRLLSHGLFPTSVDSNALRSVATQIAEYYLGRPRPHSFHVIARYNRIHENDETAWHPHNYICLTAVKSLLNGNQALHFLANVLVTISRNPNRVRTELAAAVPFVQWNFPQLNTILEASLATVGTSPSEFGSGAGLALTERDLCQTASFVIDISEPIRPKYCYLAYDKNGFKPLAYPSRDLVVELRNGTIHYHSILRQSETYELCHFLAHFGIVRAEAIVSCWLLTPNQSHRSDACLDFLLWRKKIPEPDVTWRSHQNDNGIHHICDDLQRWRSRQEDHNRGPAQIREPQKTRRRETGRLNEYNEDDIDSMDGSEYVVSDADTISDDEDY